MSASVIMSCSRVSATVKFEFVLFVVSLSRHLRADLDHWKVVYAEQENTPSNKVGERAHCLSGKEILQKFCYSLSPTLSRHPGRKTAFRLYLCPNPLPFVSGWTYVASRTKMLLRPTPALTPEVLTYWYLAYHPGCLGKSYLG